MTTRTVTTLARLAALGLVVAAGATSSRAHSPGTGWDYPPACCSGDEHTGDCDAIPLESVTVRPGGYAVTLMPGDHHRVTRPQRFFIPFGSTSPSVDGGYHICLHPKETDANCFFAPPGAV